MTQFRGICCTQRTQNFENW